MKAKISTSGKVELTLVDCDGSTRIAEVTSLYSTGEDFCFDFSFNSAYEQSGGTCYISMLDVGLDHYMGVISGNESGFDEYNEYFDGYWYAYQDAYTSTISGLLAPKFGSDNKLELSIDEDGSVTLTFGANGIVTVSEPGHNVDWADAHLLPIGYDSDMRVVTASLWLMGYEPYYVDPWWDEDQGMSFGAELILSIPVSADGTAKASEIAVEDVIPGPNW